jgi:hypothetical protein
MSDIESQSPAPSTNPSADSWQQRCETLQRQVTTLLVAVTLISLTLTFYLWRQSRVSKGELDAARANAGPALQVFFDKEKPALENFRARIADFAKKNPDFLKFLNSHNITLPGQTTPVAAPAPAAVPPQIPQKAATPPKTK